MKRTARYFLLGSLFLFSLNVAACAQQPGSPGANRGKASVTLNGKEVVIDYGRPQLHSRDVMTMAAPETVWRMGMNEATELDTRATLRFQGVTVPAGKYTLWAKKISDREWILIFNKQTGQWGTEYSASNDLGATPLEMSQAAAPVETMTISLSGTGNQGRFDLGWGTYKLSTTFTAE